ncbi:MAG TPA: transposase, partial [Phormidium sp.]
MAGKARTERARAVISGFYDNCKKHKPRKKGYPGFKKEQTDGSVEYETSGWKLPEERRYITFRDGFK